MRYRLIDADEHYYEPDDCFSRHIEARFRDETIRVRRGADGLGRIFLGGRRVFMSVMPGDYASAPGALQGLFVGEVADGFTHREVINAKDHPEFTQRPARLALMDAQGVEAAILLPTLAVAVEYDLRDDVELTYASLRAFNRWLEEDWGYGADGRIFSVPMLSLLDLDRAMTELHRVIEAGARLVHLCPENRGNPSHHQSPLQWALCNTERPVVDTLIALTLHNLFGRHPAVKVLSIENGSAWLKPLLKSVDKAAALGRRGPMIGGPLPPRPSEALAEHLWICPFPEDDVGELIGAVGADHVLFGSDYPHPEGIREPADFAARLSGCDAAVARKVLRGNTAGLLGLPDHAAALSG